MPFVPAAAVAEVELRCTLAGQRVENTLYWRLTAGGTPTPVQVETLTEDLYAWFIANYLPQSSASLTLRSLYGRDLTTASGAVHERVSAPGEVGGVGGNAASNNVSLCLSFKTGLAGRSNRGRNYMMGIPASSVAGNLISGPYMTAMLDAYNELIDPAFSPGWKWGVLSRFSGGAPRAAGVFTLINSVGFYDDVVDSMRRRLPGRGI